MAAARAHQTAQKQARLKHAVAMWGRSALNRAWAAWHGALAQRSVKRQALLLAVSSFQHRGLASAWWAWQAFAAASTLKREHALWAFQFWHQRHLAAAWLTWRAQTRQAQVKRQMVQSALSHLTHTVSLLLATNQAIYVMPQLEQLCSDGDHTNL